MICIRFPTSERNDISINKENSIGPGSYFQNDESLDSKIK